MKNYRIESIERIQYLETLPLYIKRIITILLEAINDWPSIIEGLDDYELKVFSFIGNEVTEMNLQLCLQQIDYSKSAWEAESLSQLIEIFKFYDETKSLKEIIKNIETYLTY